MYVYTSSVWRIRSGLVANDLGGAGMHAIGHFGAKGIEVKFWCASLARLDLSCLVGAAVAVLSGPLSRLDDDDLRWSIVWMLYVAMSAARGSLTRFEVKLDYLNSLFYRYGRLLYVGTLLFQLNLSFCMAINWLWSDLVALCFLLFIILFSWFLNN